MVLPSFLFVVCNCVSCLFLRSMLLLGNCRANRVKTKTIINYFMGSRICLPHMHFSAKKVLWRAQNILQEKASVMF